MKTRLFCLMLAVALLPIHLATADVLFCKPLPFHRFSADEWEIYQSGAGRNRLVAQPFEVRLVYFRPSDRQFNPDVEPRLKELIRQAQAFYAEQMALHGFGQRTFAFETDAVGEPIVHVVNGLFPESQYQGTQTTRAVQSELEAQFSLLDNIYLVAVDVSDARINGAGGSGGPVGPNGGVAYVPASGTNLGFTTVAHELGHAFGLHHDFNDDSFIMTYGGNQNRLSPCDTEFLAVSRYFNAGTFFSENPPKVRLLSSPEYTAGADSVTVRVELTDVDGLHQVQFLPITTDFENGINRVAAVGSPEVQECRTLNGQQVVVEFTYSKLAGAEAHRLAIGAVDKQGHAELKRISIFSTNHVGRTLQVSQGGGTQFNSVGAALADVLPRDRIEITDNAAYAERVQVLESFISIGASAGFRPSVDTIIAFGTTDLTLENLGVSGGIFIQDGSMVTVRGSTLENFQSAVLVTNDSQGIVEDSELRNSQNGVTVQFGSQATVRNSVIADNSNAAIAVIGSEATIADNDIRRNANGLLIQDNAQATVTGNTITETPGTTVLISAATATVSSNQITQNAQTGVFVQNGSTVTLIDNRITENPAGGVVILGSTGELRDNLIERNSDGDANVGSDRAIVVQQATAPVLIKDNTINRNGAGVFAFDGSELLLSNNVISHTENTDGYGVLLQGSSGRLVNNTIAFTPIGLLVFQQAVTPQVEVVNTIFAENVTDVANFNLATPSSFIRNSLLSTPPFAGQDGNIDADPQFIDANTDDFRLKSTSPAIDAGDDTLADLPEFDLDGRQRVFGAGVDIGAYEFGSVPPDPTVHTIQITFPAGTSLRHLPLQIKEVNGQPRILQRISDLYDALGGATNVHQLLVYDSQQERFRTFSQFEIDHASALDAIPSNIPLAPHTGVIAIMKNPVVLTLIGDAPDGAVPMTAGLNLVGLPLNPNNPRIRDLAQLPGLSGNITQVFSFDGTRFNRFIPGNGGDELVVGGHAYVIEMRNGATVQFNGEVWE